MTLNMNNGHTRFFQIQDRNTGDNLDLKSYSGTIKNYNRAIAMRIFVRRQ